VAHDLLDLPADLPVPQDDGATDHLRGRMFPDDVSLVATSGRLVRLADLVGITVLFIFPRMGRPDREPLGGITAWNAVPGARGCTPQACAYRDHFSELTLLGVRVFGLSAQSTADQQEAAYRLGLPYELLSDVAMALGRRLRQPTFQFGGQMLYRRHTLVLVDGRVEQVFYPVFPPDQDVINVLEWLRTRLSAAPTR
jgi:peroxiredoxin